MADDNAKADAIAAGAMAAEAAAPMPTPKHLEIPDCLKVLANTESTAEELKAVFAADCTYKTPIKLVAYEGAGCTADFLKSGLPTTVWETEWTKVEDKFYFYHEGTYQRKGANKILFIPITMLQTVHVVDGKIKWVVVAKA